MNGYLGKDATSNRSLQSLTCRVLLTQKCLLELFMNWMDSEAEWTPSVKAALRSVTENHRTLRLNFDVQILLLKYVFSIFIPKESPFGTQTPTPIYHHPRKLDSQDETWRAGWPESAERFWQLVRVACSKKITLLIDQ